MSMLKESCKRKLSLKRNDLIQVMVGKDKGKIGKVMRVDAEDMRVLVEGVNIVTRHVKGKQNAPGEIRKKESAIHYANVLLYCSACVRGVRHRRLRHVDADNKTVVQRQCVRCKNMIVQA